MTMKVALAQFAPTIDVADNTRIASEYIRDSAAGGARLVVLPEYTIYTDIKREFPGKRYSEPLDGDFITALREAAKTHDTYVLVGTNESIEGDADKVYNTLVLIDPAGAIQLTYKKIHLYDAFGYKESDTIVPGPLQTPPTFDIDGVKFGAITCYDIRFPELTRLLAIEGIDCLLVPAAWAVGPAKEYHWEALLRARAIENTIYTIGVGQTAPICTGNSQAFDPMGFNIAHGGEKPGIVYAELSAARVQEVRVTNPSLHNRRINISAG